ncbi:Protein NRT1/ PTR FAMILY 5.12, partial [Mucuna pruriens]
MASCLLKFLRSLRSKGSLWSEHYEARGLFKCLSLWALFSSVPSMIAYVCQWQELLLANPEAPQCFKELGLEFLYPYLPYIVFAALVEIKRLKTARESGVVDEPNTTVPMMIEQVTGKDGQDSWFANNLNKAHLDYFYWLLAGFSVMGLTLFICFVKSYIYNHKGIRPE